MDLRITANEFFRFQFGVVTLLIVMGTFHYVYAGVFGVDTFTKLSRVFDVDRENSIPTVFSIFNLLCSCVLLFIIYIYSKKRGEPGAFHWLILSIIFLGLSFDEGAGFHERLSGLGLFTNILDGRWIVYGALFSLAVFLFFIPFLLQIDRRTATLFVLSGAIFVTGAVGFEYLGGWPARFDKDFLNQALRIGEESFEMYGIAIFNCTLFARIAAANISVITGSKPKISSNRTAG